MDIKPPSAIIGPVSATYSASGVNSAATVPVPVHWQTNLVLQALVLKIENQQLLLDIDGTLAQAPQPANLPVRTSDKLMVQITQLHPVPTLKVLAENPVITSQPLKAVQQALQQFQQAPRTTQPLFDQLVNIAQKPLSDSGQFPVAVKKQIRELLLQVKDVSQLKEASKLKQAIQYSGIQTEATLVKHAQQPELLNKDIGVQLLRLATQLREHIQREYPSVQLPVTSRRADVSTGTVSHSTQTAYVTEKPPVSPSNIATPTPVQDDVPYSMEQQLLQLLDKTEQATQRQQYQQLLSLPSESSSRQPVLLDLPIRFQHHVDVMHLEIEPDSTSPEQEQAGEKTWRVTLEFHFAQFGPVRAQLRLYNKQLSLHFNMSNQATRTAFEDALPWLNRQLDNRGIHVQQIDFDTPIPATTATQAKKVDTQV